MSDTLQTIKTRRSIRRYKKADVPIEKIKILLDAANWAPSNGNSQPWRFIVAKNDFAEKISKTFYEWAKGYIPKADYIPEEKKIIMLEYAKDFGGAPVHIIITYKTYGDEIKTEESLMAASAAVQNLCLAAKDADLGSVWIAGHVAHDESTRKLLNLKEEEKVAGIIPIGYPDMDPPAPPRKDPNLQQVTWLGY